MSLQDQPVRVRVEGVTPLLQAGGSHPTNTSPEEALWEVLREFEWHAYHYSASAWVRPDDGTGGAALVFRHPGRALQVIGTSTLAEQFRELLRNGVAGWTLYPMPTTRTLLELAEPTLGHRAYNVLSREGFTTVEELAVSPDEALLELRNLGPRTLDAIRHAVAAYSDTAVAHPCTADTQGTRRAHIDAALSPAHRVRNAQLLELLAASSVPLEAVDAILASLEAEPIPPVDPMVILLLRTASEPELAAVYERARQPGPEDSRGPGT